MLITISNEIKINMVFIFSMILKTMDKITSAFMHPGFRPSLYDLKGGPEFKIWPQNSSTIPAVFHLLDRTKLTQIQAPKCGSYFIHRPY